jgi:PAS domain-containing protein
MSIWNSDGKESFLQSILNAFPHPVFVVDSDIRILAFNRAANGQFIDLSDAVILSRSGDAFNCLHANESPLGCGSGEACKTCDIRNTVSKALNNSDVYRTRVKLETLTAGLADVTHLLITASPFSYEGGKYILLTLEDINDLIALRNFVPICAKCKNIRDEKNYWIRLENYFKDHLNLDFSHGICPECSKAMYPMLHSDAEK